MPLYFDNRIVTRLSITGKSVRNRAALPLIGLAALLLLIAPHPSRGQNSSAASPDSTSQPTLVAEEEGEDAPRRKLVKWNEFDGVITTVRVGAGFLYEGAAYVQDEESKQQFDLEPAGKVRDFRLLFSGRLKTKRSITWKTGVMYDGPSDSWLLRETGIMVAVPELRGHIFIGRTKEGFSLNKVMVGYAGWTMERATMSDATVPILGDGVKWLGYVPELNLIWNIGYYIDSFNARQAFSTYDNQFVVRIAWVKLLSEAKRTLLHLGFNGRSGAVDDDELQIRSRPEAFPASYFVDTGKFRAYNTRMAGWEVYYRAGRWLFGNEYWAQAVNSPDTGDPLFHGGDVAATWLITGETRTYNTVGGFFKAVSPAKTVFQGGPGAWEAVLRFSYIDLDSGTLRGGKFWRITPMVNWHLSDNLRLELTYGYGMLERFDRKGATHFFQSRIQMQI
ncbi:MAG: porin [Calditrichaceae bacterium]|nr:porin [Calditrichia bacterium]NUQ43628.1 porin [Calditrichaceae bacterium]